jgi:spoIIIJ-associated protein
MEKDIKKLLDELFDLIGIKVKVDVKKDGEAYKVEIDPGESAGLLIGGHGLTLAALQSFVAIAIKQQTGEWLTIIVDIAGWSEKQNQRLIEMAEQTAARVIQTGEEQKLYNLTPLQRRVVHTALSTNADITTSSEGEGQDRYLIVKPQIING